MRFLKLSPHSRVLFTYAVPTLLIPTIWASAGCNGCTGGSGEDSDLDGYTSDVDCNDFNPNIHPNAAEQCNLKDDNCNDEVDEGVQLETIAAGSAHSANACTDGSMWSWGNTGEGQTGVSDGDPLLPNPVPDVAGVVQLAGGFAHTLAAKDDGTVLAMGWNAYGQLGDGSSNGGAAPVEVSGLADVVMVAAGSYHSVALKADGTVWTWGDNEFGMLGTGKPYEELSQSATPVQVSGLSGVVYIAAGQFHTLAVKSDGTVYGWGYNASYQLGDTTGDALSTATPVKIDGLAGVMEVAGGSDFTLALTSSGTVYGVGGNGLGQLGMGSLDLKFTPTQITTLSSVTGIAAGAYHGLAVVDGDVYSWGYNVAGQLGDGTSADRTTPGLVEDIDGVAMVAGGAYHSLALGADGSYYAWGSNDDGQLGDGTGESALYPVQLNGVP